MNKLKKHVKKRAFRCAAVTALTCTMLLQPCFSFTSLAYTGQYDYDYDSSYYEWGNSSGRNITSVTKTYDDGSDYKADYRYDDEGNQISAAVTESDGSRSTTNRTFDGYRMISETVYDYDAYLEAEKTETTVQMEGGEYIAQTYKYADGTTGSEESWYDDNRNIVKRVKTDSAGVISQTDNVYNDNGELVSSNMAATDGSYRQEARQYDESGRPEYYLINSYDAALQEQKTEELRTHEGGGTTQTQTTEADGTQYIENYIYNDDGEETLYTKTGPGGVLEKRETTFTTGGYKRVTTDSTGTTISVRNEGNNGETSWEDTYSFADGTFYYSKYVYSDNYDLTTVVRQEKDSEGKETYYERSYSDDGSTTEKEISPDGTVTVTKEDYLGNIIGSTKTLPDGISAETSNVLREDGLIASEITQYSDGSTDRSDYEYDEAGQCTKEVKTRRNGVSATAMYQYSQDGSIPDLEGIVFNNGCQVTTSFHRSSDLIWTLSAAYATGEIVEETVILNDYDTTYYKIIYRDGRVEEASFNPDKEDEWEAGEAVYDTLVQHYNDYIEQAWNILP